MRAPVLYRVAAGILLLFAMGHTFGFTRPEPAWHLGGLVAQMQSARFDVGGGVERSFWDFYVAAGLLVGLCLLFSSVLAWQLARLPAETLRQLRLAQWAFAATFAVATAICAIHLFLIPILFSAAACLCLAAAAWVSGREAP
jgi:hypothetical protein